MLRARLRGAANGIEMVVRDTVTDEVTVISMEGYLRPQVIYPPFNGLKIPGQPNAWQGPDERKPCQ